MNYAKIWRETETRLTDVALKGISKMLKIMGVPNGEQYVFKKQVHGYGRADSINAIMCLGQDKAQIVYLDETFPGNHYEEASGCYAIMIYEHLRQEFSSFVRRSEGMDGRIIKRFKRLQGQYYEAERTIATRAALDMASRMKKAGISDGEELHLKEPIFAGGSIIRVVLYRTKGMINIPFEDEEGNKLAIGYWYDDDPFGPNYAEAISPEMLDTIHRAVSRQLKQIS